MAEAQLRSGEFVVIAEIGNTSESSATVRFMLGDEQQVPAIQITTTYTSTVETQTNEYIQVGGDSWERRDNGNWSTVVPDSGPGHQLRSYLPHIDTAADPVITMLSDRADIRWFDAAYQADVILVVDATTGTPIEMRRELRSTGMVLSVFYRGWNTPVSIVVPEVK